MGIPGKCPVGKSVSHGSALLANDFVFEIKIYYLKRFELKNLKGECPSDYGIAIKYLVSQCNRAKLYV